MDYFEDTEYGVDSLWFIRGLEPFTGHGLLTWHHDKGFHLLAFLDKATPATPSALPFGEHELETGPRRLTEMRKANEGHSLGVLRPFPDQHQLHKEWFIRLTEYFGRNGPNTDVC